MDIAGQRFGKQVVVRELGGDRVEIKCDCGTIKATRKQYLLDGSSRSCGCGRYGDRSVPVRVGDTKHMLLVIEKLGTNGHKRELLVRCLCGGHKVITEDAFRRGTTKSCGCLRRRRMSGLNVRHGESGRVRTTLYNTWSGMWNRIRSPHRYPTYIGITIHPDWKSFETFRDYILDTLGDRPSGHSLDRIENDRGYEPGNVRWLSAKQQTRNRSSNVFIEVNGERRCIAEWAERLGVDAQVIGRRLARGWSPERAVTGFARKWRPRVGRKRTG